MCVRVVFSFLGGRNRKEDFELLLPVDGIVRQSLWFPVQRHEMWQKEESLSWSHEGSDMLRRRRSDIRTSRKEEAENDDRLSWDCSGLLLQYYDSIRGMKNGMNSPINSRAASLQLWFHFLQRLCINWLTHGHSLGMNQDCDDDTSR